MPYRCAFSLLFLVRHLALSLHFPRQTLFDFRKYPPQMDGLLPRRSFRFMLQDKFIYGLAFTFPCVTTRHDRGQLNVILSRQPPPSLLLAPYCVSFLRLRCYSHSRFTPMTFLLYFRAMRYSAQLSCFKNDSLSTHFSDIHY